MLFIFISIVLSIFAKDFYEQYSYATIGGESKMMAKRKAISYMKNQFTLKIVPYVFRKIHKRYPDKKVEMNDYQRNYVNSAIDSMLIIDESWDGAVYKVKAKVFIDENKLFPQEEQITQDSTKTDEADKFLVELKKWSKSATNDMESFELEKEYVSTEQKLAATKAYDNAILYLNIGNYQKAIKYLKKTLKNDPYFKNAELNLGICYLKVGRFLDAVKTLKRVVTKDTKNPNAFFNLGVAYLKILNWERAIKNFEKAVELKNDYKEAYYNLGYAYLQDEKYEKSIQASLKATELDSTDYQAYFNLGYAYDDLKQYDKAIENYKKAIKLKEDFSDAYTNLGLAYYHVKEYDKAVEALKKAIEINPDDDTAYFNLGKVYFDMNQKDKSLEAYQQAARMGNIEAQRYLRKEGYSW